MDLKNRETTHNRKKQPTNCKWPSPQSTGLSCVGHRLWRTWLCFTDNWVRRSGSHCQIHETLPQRDPLSVRVHWTLPSPQLPTPPLSGHIALPRSRILDFFVYSQINSNQDDPGSYEDGRSKSDVPPLFSSDRPRIQGKFLWWPMRGEVLGFSDLGWNGRSHGQTRVRVAWASMLHAWGATPFPVTNPRVWIGKSLPVVIVSMCGRVPVPIEHWRRQRGPAWALPPHLRYCIYA
jgi:hypothetical protein